MPPKGAQSKRKKAGDDDDGGEPVPKAKAKEKAKAKAKAKVADKNSAPLPNNLYKRFHSKVTYAMKSGKTDQKEEAAEALQAYEDASHDEKREILDLLEKNSTLKYIPTFVRSKREDCQEAAGGR